MTAASRPEHLARLLPYRVSATSWLNSAGVRSRSKRRSDARSLPRSSGTRGEGHDRDGSEGPTSVPPGAAAW